MCLVASLFERSRQKKAAEKAQKRMEQAQAAAQASARAEREQMAANQAAEAQTVDVGETTSMSHAQRLHGVSSTFLASKGQNENLGD